MSKNNPVIKIVLLICFSIFFLTQSKTANIPDSEIWHFSGGSNPIHPTMGSFEFSSLFPENGQFDNGIGLAGNPHWTVDTSGFGIVTSYSNATEGWVGIRCAAGQSAAIEFGHISMSTVTTFSGNTARPGYHWDQYDSCLHFRGNPVSPYNSKLGGKVECDFYDASGSLAYEAIAFDASSSAVNNNYYPVVGLDSTGKPNSLAWASFSWQVTPPHQNWYRISKVRISYTVPYGVSSTTEVQFDQFYIVTSWFQSNPNQ